MSLESTREFFEIAGRQGMLPLETLRDLQLEATSRQVDGASLVLQKGLLTPLDVEIIETLRQPAAAIPGYEIQAVIGRGGMGVVYRARHLALDRTVALKMILVSHTANPTMLSRFEQEAQTVARLLHPHIITAYDFGRHEGRLFFAMEYVEGEDAEGYIARLHPLSERQVWHLVRQTAAGLAHASESGIVHRDIKPANLLLVDPPMGYPLPPGTPMVKIADFGLAFLSSDVDDRTRLTAEHTTLGSPHYMAPEQLHAGQVVDQRADIYSLGATAFHLLAGQAPFHGLTLPQIIARKLGDGPASIAQIRSGLSPESIRLLERMLARDPAQRISSYAELMLEIDRLPVMVEARSPASPSLMETGGIENRHHRLKLWGLATVVGLVATLIGFSLIPRKGEQGAPAVTPSTLKETGWATELFDGKSIQGWRTVSGVWNADVDDEGGRILSGSSGEVARSLVKPVGPRSEPLNYYRLTLAARLHKGSAIELHFNFGAASIRHVLRLTPDQVALGQRADGRSPFKPQGASIPFEIGTDRLHELRLQRDAAQWLLFIDETPVGSVPASSTREQPEFHLVAEGGPAWFGDVYVEELAERTSKSPGN
jgi:serine/threonine protein kinase